MKSLSIKIQLNDCDDFLWMSESLYICCAEENDIFLCPHCHQLILITLKCTYVIISQVIFALVDILS